MSRGAVATPASHTPEPWEMSVNADREWDVCATGGGDMIASLAECDNAEANAARIVACVNALAGVPDPEAAVRALRDAAVDALDYFEDREDADHNGENFVGNAAMSHATALRAALSAFGAA